MFSLGGAAVKPRLEPIRAARRWLSDYRAIDTEPPGLEYPARGATRAPGNGGRGRVLAPTSLWSEPAKAPKRAAGEQTV